MAMRVLPASFVVSAILMSAALALSVPSIQAAEWSEMRATDLLERKVVNRQGEALGELRELMIDMRTGRLHYAVLELGGTLGINEKLIPYPVSALSPGQNGETVILDVQPEALADAAGFERDRWPAWNDPVWDKAERPRSGSSSSAGAGASNGHKQFMRASDLVGRSVQDRDGSAIGNIDDLILNLDDDTVRHVAIALDGGRARIRVPLSRIHRQIGAPGQPLVLEMDRDRLPEPSKGHSS
jgi:sporulation protein YlmC with PRC-barrel domain